MERFAITKRITENFSMARVPGGQANVLDKQARLSAEIESKTAEFLADGGEIELCETGASNFQPTIQIVINADTDRRCRMAKKK